MKNIYICSIAIILIIWTIPSHAQVIQEFNVKNENNAVIIEWKSAIESGIREYRVQRSLDGREFHDISNRIDPLGSNRSYSYVDNDLFKETMNTFYYRVEVVMTSGRSQLSAVKEVTLSFSSVRRTWGSLKAMFR